MPNKVDAAIAEHNAIKRAELRHPQPQSQPATISEALANERAAAHGDDSGRAFRDETAGHLVALSKNLEAVRRNPTLNAAQVEIAAADLVKAKADRILDDFAGQRQIVADKQRKLDNETDDALRTPRPDWAATGAELRGVLRGMDDNARHAFLDRVEGTRDELMVQYAIGGMPAVLSGVSIETHNRLRDGLLERRDPTLLTQPIDLQQRSERLDQCEAGFRRSIAELVDFDKAAAFRALSEPSS